MKVVAGHLKNIFIKANKHCIIYYDVNKKVACITFRNGLIIEIYCSIFVVVWGWAKIIFIFLPEL